MRTSAAARLFDQKTELFYALLHVHAMALSPVTFNIDKNYINSKTQYFQKKYHPDKYNSREQQLQKYASEFSSYVNEARDVLLNDVKRMQYLVSMLRLSSKLRASTTKSWRLKLNRTLAHPS